MSISEKKPAAGLLEPMKKYEVNNSIAEFTPTLCALWDIREPKQCQANAVKEVLQAAETKLGTGAKLQKSLVFCPDAIGDFLQRDYSADFQFLHENCDIKIKAASVRVSVTPVCFASIFSGTEPAVHGIETYMKPVLSVETLFDVFAEAGKNVAIVSHNECSIDKIFRGRNIDYFSLRDHAKSFEMCKLLLKEYDYDLIVCYDGSYDSNIHKYGCYSKEAIQAMRDSIARYTEFSHILKKRWKDYNYLLSFTPDHGGSDSEHGKGKHADDQYDNMVVNHFYQFNKVGNRE